MVKRCIWVARSSNVLRFSLNQFWLEEKYPEFTKWFTNRFSSVMWISETIYTKTLYWVVVRQCFQACNKGWPKRLQQWFQNKQRSKCLLLKLKKGSSWHGLEVQSYLHCRHSKKCGSLRQSIKSKEIKLFIKSVYEFIHKKLHRIKKQKSFICLFWII